MDCYYKLRQLFYYKLRHGLLQIATGITKCDGFITNCDRYYKVRWLFQIATVQKKSAHLKWAAHGLRVEPRKMRKRHLSMGPRCGSWSRYNGYRAEQHNVMIDVLGARGYSRQLEKSARKQGAYLSGCRSRSSQTLWTLAKSTRIIHHNQLLMTKSVQSLQQDVVSNCVECCAKIQQDNQGHMLQVYF